MWVRLKIINRYSSILYLIEYKKNINKKQEQNFENILKNHQNYDINRRNKRDFKLFGIYEQLKEKRQQWNKIMN